MTQTTQAPFRISMTITLPQTVHLMSCVGEVVNAQDSGAINYWGSFAGFISGAEMTVMETDMQKLSNFKIEIIEHEYRSVVNKRYVREEKTYVLDQEALFRGARLMMEEELKTGRKFWGQSALKIFATEWYHAEIGKEVHPSRYPEHATHTLMSRGDAHFGDANFSDIYIQYCLFGEEVYC